MDQKTDKKNGIKFIKNNKTIPGAHLQSLFFS